MNVASSSQTDTTLAEPDPQRSRFLGYAGIVMLVFVVVAFGAAAIVQPFRLARYAKPEVIVHIGLVPDPPAVATQRLDSPSAEAGRRLSRKCPAAAGPAPERDSPLDRCGGTESRSAVDYLAERYSSVASFGLTSVTRNRLSGLPLWIRPSTMMSVVNQCPLASIFVPLILTVSMGFPSSSSN